MPSAQIYLLAGFTALTLCLLNRLIKNYLALHHLHLPGPILAKLTSKWLLVNFARGNQMNAVHALHLKHGPVVQIGPREISFSSGKALKDIYSPMTKCMKSPIYESMGRPGVFGMRDKEQHRERRNRVAHVFAMNVLKELEPAVQAQIANLTRILGECGGRPFDVVKPMRMLALDIMVGEILLGQCFNALGAADPPYYVTVMNYVHPMFSIDREVPWLGAFLRMLPIKKYGEQQMRDSIAKFGRHSPRRNIMTKLIAGDPEKGTLPLPDQNIADEVSNFIYAAVDTTGVVMAYFLYELASNPIWQGRLREELIIAEIREKDFPYQQIQQLQVLHACMYETLRLHPGAGVGLPRITPPGGLQIDNIFVPGNMTVHTPTLTLQRDPSVFPIPDSFNPSRWLTSSNTFVASSEMQAHTFIWGGGEHNCAGQNMATMEIKIMAARVMSEFKVRVESERTHQNMRMRDHFVIAPKGGKGLLVFERVEVMKD
ncbi:cytochrome P450 [Lindgomyces ingoldianus]|uniref:Cytochrome P450 n=1 Tax=Lindgomyces ingoldianus TaxID=673940 RepID=A0ACB6REK9_9PLEO|nr:cytochrome P450 [Lindgomyces ingoldianus]KAF2477738.1 cytochrome P450 [Lindgomyces ingoldianus]